MAIATIAAADSGKNLETRDARVVAILALSNDLVEEAAGIEPASEKVRDALHAYPSRLLISPSPP